MCEESFCKFEYKGMNTVRVQITQTRHPLSISYRKNVQKFNTRQKLEKSEMCIKYEVHIFNV